MTWPAVKLVLGASFFGFWSFPMLFKLYFKLLIYLRMSWLNLLDLSFSSFEFRMSKNVYLAILLASFRLIDPESLGIFYDSVSTLLVRNLKSFSMAFCLSYISRIPSNFFSLLLMMRKFLIILSSNKVILIKVPVKVICYSSICSLISIIKKIIKLIVWNL